MTDNELGILQHLPLDVKVLKTKFRIQEWIYFHGVDNVYVSFSGGKDSTVLLHIVRQLFPNIKAVFVNTGLEYPEILDFVKSTKLVITIKPKISFRQVLIKYGYPVITKEQADYICRVRKNRNNQDIVNQYMNGIYKNGKNTRFVISKKWHYLVDEAPFKISANCCNIMKKAPLKSYENKNNSKPFIGTLAVESVRRKQNYKKTGCNAFNLKRQYSIPLGFWTEQDILQYIQQENLKIADCYGDIVKENGILKTTKCSRTGCIFCLFGCHLEKQPNRIQLLAETHPTLYEYCLRDYDKGGLGLKPVMEFCNIPYD